MASRTLRFLTQAWTAPTNPTTSFAGKNILITGANTGLGFEAATKFVALGADRVILGVRDLTKGGRAKELIEQRTGVKGKAEPWQLDMCDYRSMVRFATRAAELQRLDVAVLNAGVYKVKYEMSRYGLEETLQVNVVSTALLGLLLLPVLKKARRKSGVLPVLEIVTSGNHETIQIPEERRVKEKIMAAYNDDKGYDASVQYKTSKLFAMYVMQSLAMLARLEDGELEVLVTSVCPGAAKSDLSRGYDGLGMRMMKSIINAVLLRTTEQGARSLVSGVTLGKKAHGRFWQHDEIRPPAPLVSGTEGEGLRRKVWAEVIEALANIPELVSVEASPSENQIQHQLDGMKCRRKESEL
ncbi:short-chain dehydrogenase/reductase family protein-like protein [Mytilinidion resinicola]|uniref:Short-chain dehydrogenase/reductase family protein-like protein n=1 Tax=Mytilinidion resinicola TaxID=574789 RepID=A0A6A6YSM8_9PEZI|nr:short-chain dehydrogenase/reductase family protein-like protein [Mytilinidion resinicola]KAF2810965.1 short-chain dehydrogenase/reductase family protein-like protein [Mytilinidion resinicola]